MRYKRPSFKELQLHDNIRNRMYKNGVATLSNFELLSIIIHTGRYDKSDLAKQILSVVNNDLNILAKCTVDDLMMTPGIGPTKAERIVATFELCRRKSLSTIIKRKQIHNSSDIYDLLKSKLENIDHEECWVVYMNNQHNVLDIILISHGGVSETTVDPKIILKKALLLLANAIILVHNHPSDNPQPSSNDDRITQKVKNSCINLDIQFTDHLIFCDNSYYSYADEGKI